MRRERPAPAGRFDRRAPGYARSMEAKKPVEKAEEIVKAPVERTEELHREAAEGSSERTPFLVLSGVHLVVGLVAAAVIALAFLVYWLA